MKGSFSLPPFRPTSLLGGWVVFLPAITTTIEAKAKEKPREAFFLFHKFTWSYTITYTLAEFFNREASLLFIISPPPGFMIARHSLFSLLFLGVTTTTRQIKACFAGGMRMDLWTDERNSWNMEMIDHWPLFWLVFDQLLHFPFLGSAIRIACEEESLGPWK